MLSNLIKSVPSSAIIDTFNRAYDLRLNGADLIDLSVGEPDFDTPEHIRLAGIAAINIGDTHYSPSDGTTVLKQAIARKFARDNDLQFQIPATKSSYRRHFEHRILEWFRPSVRLLS